MNKYIGIPMTSENVLKILAGTKTQTRRVVTPSLPDGYEWSDKHLGFLRPDSNLMLLRKCRHGANGDYLWVREQLERREHQYGVPSWAVYSADVTGVEYKPGAKLGYCGHAVWEWKNKVLPARYCPRWASRITLKITDLTVERLQDISDEDCIAEGFPHKTGSEVEWRGWYKDLWDSLNKTRGYGWDDNPHVFVIKFRRLDEKR